MIEDASTGIALAQELRQAGTYAVRPIPVERDKIAASMFNNPNLRRASCFFPKPRASSQNWKPSF
jgi:hypothetical protein